MGGETVIFSMFLIFTGAAIFATAFLFTGQPLLIAYILLGVVLGPSGLAWLDDPSLVAHIANIGIIFLLFLLGLNLHPQNLLHLFKKTFTITLLSSLVFSSSSFLLAYAFGFSALDSLVIGAAMMFSSTIIGLKLLPTTVLHHQRMGEVVISVLLLQDLIAIIVMLLFNIDFAQGIPYQDIGSLVLSLPALIAVCFILDRYVLMRLISRFDRIQEYIFLLALGWCLGVSELAQHLGLSYEIGAFIAGVSIATSPIALYISEALKPLRDFFLIMFFFALGASFNTAVLSQIWLPATLIALLMLIVKPATFWFLFRKTKESAGKGLEMGVRLGQVSEFSLLVAYVAYETQTISMQASYLIQATTIITFICSSYYIVKKYPTPISPSEAMRKD